MRRQLLESKSRSSTKLWCFRLLLFVSYRISQLHIKCLIKWSLHIKSHTLEFRQNRKSFSLIQRLHTKKLSGIFFHLFNIETLIILLNSSNIASCLLNVFKDFNFSFGMEKKTQKSKYREPNLPCHLVKHLMMCIESHMLIFLRGAQRCLFSLLYFVSLGFNLISI